MKIITILSFVTTNYTMNIFREFIAPDLLCLFVGLQQKLTVKNVWLYVHMKKRKLNTISAVVVAIYLITLHIYLIKLQSLWSDIVTKRLKLTEF